MAIEKTKDIEQMFKDRQGDQVKLLQESIQDIQAMIAERQVVHKDMLDRLDKLEMFINNNMPELRGVSIEAIAAQKEIIKELLKKKIDIEELRIQEKLNVWRDKALLKKELREHMKEFRDMESKSSMIDNIIGL